MSSQATVLDVGNTIGSVGCLKVIRATHSASQITYECSCTNAEMWHRMLDPLLRGVRGYRAHICNRFVVREGQFLALWHLQFMADDIASVSTQIQENILKARVTAEKVLQVRTIREAKPVVVTGPDAPIPSPAPAKRGASGRDRFVQHTQTIRQDDGSVIVLTEAPVPWKNQTEPSPTGRGATPVRPE